MGGYHPGEILDSNLPCEARATGGVRLLKTRRKHIFDAPLKRNRAVVACSSWWQYKLQVALEAEEYAYHLLMYVIRRSPSVPLLIEEEHVNPAGEYDHKIKSNQMSRNCKEKFSHRSGINSSVSSIESPLAHAQGPCGVYIRRLAKIDAKPPFPASSPSRSSLSLDDVDFVCRSTKPWGVSLWRGPTRLLWRTRGDAACWY